MKKLFSVTLMMTITLFSTVISISSAENNDMNITIKDMVLIPPGEFMMGTDASGALKSNKPAHMVYVDAFYIDKYEVSNAQYREFVLANPEWQKKNIDKKFHDGQYLQHWKENNYPSGKENHPVTYVSWYAAVAYAKWVGKRLPTEAEWEKAARGGKNNQSFPWGKENDENKANYRIGIDHDIIGDTTPVNKYPAFGFGLHDISGNVKEWCLDKYISIYYKVYPHGRPINNPIAGAESITDIISNFENIPPAVRITGRRVTRGGGWISSPREIAVYSRGSDSANTTDADIGFRCVVDLVEKDSMVLIPAGEFNMGYEGEGAYKDTIPVHKVYVDAFYMDKNEVTNAQYRKFVLANPEWRKKKIEDRFHDGDYLYEWNGNNYPRGRGNHPVTYVSWYAAMAYAKWVGKRLPTEAEWEKAARGGLKGKHYPWGNSIDANKANYRSSNIGDTVPVGASLGNAYDLYDMSGNVSEWCLDGVGWNFYRNSPYKNPIEGEKSITELVSNFKNIESEEHRARRGGAWNDAKRFIAVFHRDYNLPYRTESVLGFRCVKEVKP